MEYSHGFSAYMVETFFLGALKSVITTPLYRVCAMAFWGTAGFNPYTVPGGLLNTGRGPLGRCFRFSIYDKFM